MMKTNLILALGRLIMASVLGLLLASTVQAELAVIPDTEVSTLVSQATGETYRITVYVPPTGPDASAPRVALPTIYVLDGLWHFARTQALCSGLAFDKDMPPAILVAVDYPVAVPEVLKKRQLDLTYGTAAEPGPAGGAPAFLRFLAEELTPWIEARYPSDPAARALAGHSYAGHFALYAWAARPGFYTRVLAASPYWNPSLRAWLEKDAPGVSRPTPAPRTRLDVSSGAPGVEYADCTLSAEVVDSVRAFERRGGVGTDLRFAMYPDLKHAAVAHTIYAHGLPWLFSEQPGRTERLSWQSGLGDLAPLK